MGLVQYFVLIFCSSGIADFAPWIGGHPEDVLNDQTVKHGFIDRIPVAQNETNTARQSLYGLFKHKSGLQNLSALFAMVVKERQAHSKISSASSFKPPPRVTLTEAKRKAWLSDLADSAVPLRKLSRTIPQGIRGQSLLDQCFANNVPIGRAIWFAKCVGANEIRTLKRKGTNSTFYVGAEIKWLKDWTTNIEQFLESNIEQCGQADWRPRMNYALSLAVRLYSESLLDRDHYLDWIVKSISAANIDRVPVWLLMVHLHKADLIRHRKRGRILVESLLEMLRIVTEPGLATLETLVGKLKHTLRSFMLTNQNCFVMSQSWKRYESIVEKCLDLRTASDALVLQQIAHRNVQILAASGLDLSDSRTPRQLVIDILDSARLPFEISRIARDCRSTSGDLDSIANTVLEWSSTRFRAGDHRVYLAVRLLQFWHGEVDINSAVIQFLASQQTRTSCDTYGLCRLVLELVRSRVFSLSRYLQWLTARGGLRNCSSDTHSSTTSVGDQPANERPEISRGFDATQVLASIPLSILSPAVKNLRNNMLARAGFSFDQEASLIDSHKDFIAKQLPRIFLNKDIEPSVSDSVPDFGELDWSVRYELSFFLQQHIASFKTQDNGSLAQGSKETEPVSALTVAEFRVIRSICESLGDLSALAEIIGICTTSDDEDLLASITDTVNFHLDAFSTMGAGTNLHTRLFRLYLSMRSRNQLPRTFIVSLISLGSLVPSHLVSVSLLQRDLATGDKSLAVAACSPVSDGMAESLQQAGPTFAEEFEAVLSSGNRMEEQTMIQLFNVLTERLEKGQYQTQAENDGILCALHARLRIYRIAQFDALIVAWLEKLLTTANSRFIQLYPVLISTGCISFGACADILLRALPSTDTLDGEGLLVRTHVGSFLEMIHTTAKSTDPVSYKLKLEYARFIRESPDRAFELQIRVGLNSEPDRIQLSDDMLIYFVLKGQALGRSIPKDPAKLIVSKLDSLLQLRREVSNPSYIAVSELVKETTDFSMLFCRLRFQLWAVGNSPWSLSLEQKATVETLFDLAKSEKDEAWTYCMAAIGREAACQIREKAEDAFFALPLLSALGRNTSVMLPVAAYIEQGRHYLRIVSRTAYSIPPNGVHSMVSTLIERFAVLLRGLNTSKISADYDANKQASNLPALDDESAQGGLDHLTAYLTLLLQITSIHRDSFICSRAEPLSSPIASQKQSQQDVVKIIVLLCNIASHPSLDGNSEVAGHALDIAATFVDDASEEVRTLCARILKDKMRDHRVVYLLGSANNARGVVSIHDNLQTGLTTEGLQIMKDGKRVGEYKPRNWEILEGGADASISLSLFDARREAR
jgi:mediator of RNA polymerase II transcription subunit 12, fungi type